MKNQNYSHTPCFITADLIKQWHYDRQKNHSKSQLKRADSLALLYSTTTLWPNLADQWGGSSLSHHIWSVPNVAAFLGHLAPIMQLMVVTQMPESTQWTMTTITLATPHSFCGDQTQRSTIINFMHLQVFSFEIDIDINKCISWTNG